MDNRERIEQIKNNRHSNTEVQLQLCQEILEHEPDDYERASALLYMSDANLDYIRLETAIRYGLKALQMASAFGYQDILMMQHNILGIAFSQAGDVNDAVEHYIQALKEAHKHDNYALMAAVYNNLTILFQENQDYDSALDFCNRYWICLQKVSYNEENIAIQERDYYLYYAELCFLKEEYEEAAKYINYVMEQDSKKTPIVYLLAARLAWHKGDKTDAYQYLGEIKSLEALHNIDRFRMTKLMLELLIDMEDENASWLMLKKLENLAQKIAHNRYWVDYWQQCILVAAKYNQQEILNSAYQEFYVRQESLEEAINQLRIQWLKNKVRIFEIQKENRQLLDEKKKLENAALKDELTGLWKRSGYQHVVREMFGQCYSEEKLFTTVIIDIDFFKEYNDTYGHQMGDACIRKIAEILKAHEGDQGCCVRFGGDEFMMFWKDIPEKAVKKRLESIISGIKKRNIAHTASKAAKQVTVSIGAVVGIPQKEMEFSEYIRCADEALYEVKKKGKAAYALKHFSPRG